MEYQKIPLEEQLGKISDGLILHPEYTARTIYLWAEMPLSEYLGGNSEKGIERRKRFRRLLRITPGEEEKMSYRDAVEHMELCRHIKKQGWRIDMALRLLAEPLKEAYDQFRRYNDEKDTA